MILVSLVAHELGVALRGENSTAARTWDLN